ncbi:MAG: hypothetical protein K0S44_1138 [Bacteroidetes bacterium]|jgi:hypothetical protein|nr:hypothetical protein [Bacteroidota bacterium]
MKIDLYTKSILTVIAAALTILVLQNTKLFNEAQAGPVKFNTPSNRSITIPVNEDGSINVKMVDDMDVNIHSIGGSSVYGALPVNLKEVGGSSFYGSLPVNLKEVSSSSINSSGIPVNIESVDGLSIYSAVPVKEMK